MGREVTSQDVKNYLSHLPQSPWEGQAPDVSFLARGEYSLNYRAGGYVVRLVTGTQIGLPLQEQAPYEYQALRLLEPSGVTPAPYMVDSEPGGLPYPLIIEEYLPGRPLDYATDMSAAARCAAAIHALGVPRKHHLQVHPDPAPAILEESREFAAPYLKWKDGDDESKEALRGAFERIEGFLKRDDLFTGDDLAIVNYDLNTHNFVVEDGRARLLDWEKARIAPLTQDLAHFLLPTTTLWRDETATRLTPEQEREFIETYLLHNPHNDVGRFMEQLEAMRVIVSLRAVSWCAWALQESEKGTRAIVNEETLRKGRMYLRPQFMRELFGLE